MAIDKLLAFGTRLGKRKLTKMQVKLRVKETMGKIEPTGFSLSHPHFIEHLAA
jgi:hypothetical protein